MSGRERLTERVGDGVRYDNGEYIITCYPKNNNLSTVDKLAAKLCDLEDKIENGTLIAPPCKVGDTVYVITECSCENIDGVHTECEFYGYGTDDRICTIPNGAKCPYQYRVIECYVTEFNILMFAREWGKTVFLTREDAERVLEEMNKS